MSTSSTIPEPRMNRVDQLNLLKARELALEAGSLITSDRTRDDLVLANTAPIEAFLLGGLPGYTSLRARCSAVAQHVKNLKTEGARSDRRDWAPDDPGAFLRSATSYAGYLSGKFRPGSYLLRILFQREIGAKGDRMYEIIRDAAGGQDATPSRLAHLLPGVDRSTIQMMLREAEVRGLIRPSGKTWPVWPGETGDEDSWVLGDISQDTQP